jgi:hypothetical protein
VSLHRNEIDCVLPTDEGYQAPQGTPWEGDSPTVQSKSVLPSGRATTLAEPLVLAALTDKWCGVKEIARRSGVARETAGYNLAALYHQLRVERKPDLMRGYLWRRLQ